MRIQWNSDAIESIIRRLAEAEEELSACSGDADRVRDALTEANPRRDDRRLNSISDRFESAMIRLESIRDELDDTVRAARRANEGFLDAERRNLRLIANIDDGQASEERQRIVAKRIPIRATVPHRPWKLPRPKVMPANYVGWPIGIPEWLTELLKDYNIDSII